MKKNTPHCKEMPGDRDDLDSEKTIQAILESLRAGGHACEFLEGDITIVDTVRKYQPDILF